MPLSRVRLSSTLPSTVAAIIFGVSLADHAASADEPTKQECVVANESAQDLQRSGKLIEAQQQLTTCAARACPRAVRTDCADRLVALAKAIPSVVLTARDAEGGDATAAALAIDGAVQSAALDGSPIPVDPGQHTFTVTLAGRVPVTLRLSVGEGEQVRREIVFKPAGPAGARNGKPTEPGGAGEAGASTEAVAGPGRQGVPRWIGWSAIGAGAAGMALGTLFGFLALGDKVSLTSACHGYACGPASADAVEGMHFNGVASNISFAVGIIGLAAGSVLLIEFPDTKKTDGPTPPPAAMRLRPWVGVGDAGLRGTFQ